MVKPIEIKEVSIELPTRMLTSKNKIDPVNLNFYRNAHFRKLAYQKKAFKESILPLIKDLPKYNSYKLHYTIYAKDKRKFDIANVASIVDKYFCDAMVEQGKFPDDDYDYLQDIHFSFGGVVGKAYAIVKITPICQEIPMKIILQSTDILMILTDYFNHQLMNIDDSGYVSSLKVENDKIIAIISNSDSEITVESTVETNNTNASSPFDDNEEDDLLDPTEAKRLELLEEAKAAKIKGIRRDMTTDTLIQKLAEHAEEQSKDAQNDDENTEDSSFSDTEGSNQSSGSSNESTSQEGDEEEEDGNPFGDSPTQSSETKDSSEDNSSSKSAFDDEDDDIFGSE